MTEASRQSLPLTARPALMAPLRRHLWLRRHRDHFSCADSGRRPRLYVDLSVISRHDARTGIQRVVRAIWSELLHEPDLDVDIMPAIAASTHGYCHARTGSSGRLEADPMKPVAMGPRDQFLGLDLSSNHLPNFVEQIGAWRSAGAKVNLVVYDLLPLLKSEWFEARSVRNFRRWFNVVRQHCDQALCISDTIAAELRGCLGAVTRPRIGRLQLSGNLAQSQPTTGLTPEIRELFTKMARHPHVMMVGTIEPRKGYLAALRAFEELWRGDTDQAPHLLIIGKAGWKTGELQRELENHPEQGRRLHWLQHCTDEALAEFYRRSRGLLVASRAEGFGLPLAEAADHGCWALARDLPIFREHALPNVIYFHDDDPATLSEAVLRLIDKSRRGTPVIPDHSSWRASVERLLTTLNLEPQRTVIREPRTDPATVDNGQRRLPCGASSG